MKKILIIMLTAVMVISSAATAFAVGSGSVSGGTTVDKTTSESTSESNVAIYGYIGPDAVIKPDPDPNNPPTSTLKMINASIPTQVLWAAFKSNFSDGSAPITSPTFYVTCNTGSEKFDVTVIGFTQTGGELPSTATLDLGLSVAGFGAPSNLLDVEDLFNLNGGVRIASLRPNTSAAITITGSYTDTGVFPEEAIQPQYEMILRLDAVI